MPTSVSTRAPGLRNQTRQQLDELDALLQRMLELPVNHSEDKNEAEEEADELPPPPITRPAATKLPSYMVVETASPRPLPAASGFEPRSASVPPPPEPIIAEAPEPLAASASVPASEAEMWVPLRSTWQPSAQTWQPLAESWRQANAATTPAAVPPSAPVPVESVQDSAPPVEPLFPNLSEGHQSPESCESRGADAPRSEGFETMSEPAPVADAPAEPRLSLTAEDAPVESCLLLPLLWFNQVFDAFMSPLGATGRWLCGPSGRQTLGLAGLACLAAAVVVAVGAGMAWPW